MIPRIHFAVDILFFVLMTFGTVSGVQFTIWEHVTFCFVLERQMVERGEYKKEKRNLL